MSAFNWGRSPWFRQDGIYTNLKHDQKISWGNKSPRKNGQMSLDYDGPKEMQHSESIKISSLQATQRGVNAAKVESIKSAGLKEQELDKRPFVVRQGGQNYLIDGHHRVTAAHEMGHDTVDVRVFDSDAHPRDENGKFT